MALTTSILRGGVNNHETTSEEANGVYTDFVSEGVLGTTANTSGVAPATGGWAVNAQGTPDMTVAVGAGTAYVTATPSTQNSQTFRVVSSAEEDVTISANSSGSTKYDWLYLKLDATTLNAPNVAGTDAATLVTSRSSSITSDDGTPPTYGILLAIITVSNGAVSITNGNIKDLRTNASIGASTADSTGWYSLGATPNTITNNGNRSYDLVFNSTDLTDTVSGGMKLRLTRTVSAPTMCADLELSSSQYFSKTTPTALGLTTAATASAWIKLESYPAGNGGTIFNTRNGTVAYTIFRINTSGQVGLEFTAASATQDSIVSYQSIPLNKWVHVAASCTANSGGNVYIDGVDVPATYTNGTTTAFGNTGDLAIGRRADSAVDYFDGGIAQVAVYSSILTANTIRSYASQTITGAESTCVGAWSFNNSINDLSATANNLTANAGATATTVDSPFGSYLGGTLEYGIITKTAFSTNTTLTVQVPEGCAIPTSGGVSAVAYSTQDTPYGFPRDRGRWGISSILQVTITASGTVAGTHYNPGGFKLTLPAGSTWDVSGTLIAQIVNSTTSFDSTQSLSTSSSAQTSGKDWSSRDYIAVMGAGSFRIWKTLVKDSIAVTTETPIYALIQSGSAFSAADLRGSVSQPTKITAILSCLG